MVMFNLEDNVAFSFLALQSCTWHKHSQMGSVADLSAGGEKIAISVVKAKEDEKYTRYFCLNQSHMHIQVLYRILNDRNKCV
mmetsp:Transcript_8148/g.12523  ORF Transcript_8148/g.12523 Transcript_8148/m.12523 type:complete len:82 (-) Transcript_8148:101-346(-)